MNNDTKKKIALGVAGAALTAGAIAAGAIFSDEGNRRKVSRKARKGLREASRVVGQLKDTMPYVTAHQIRVKKGKKKSA